MQKCVVTSASLMFGARGSKPRLSSQRTPTLKATLTSLADFHTSPYKKSSEYHGLISPALELMLSRENDRNQTKTSPCSHTDTSRKPHHLAAKHSHKIDWSEAKSAIAPYCPHLFA